MRYLSLTIIGALLTACATTSNIKSEKDTFTGGAIFKTEAIDVQSKLLTPEEKKMANDPNNPTKKSPGFAGFSISFQKTLINNIPDYKITVIDGAEMRHPIVVNKNDGLQFNIDGKITKFSTDIDSKSTEAKVAGMFAPRVYQIIPFQKVPEEFLKKLVSANEVKVRIEGAKGERTGFLAPVGKEAVSKLLLSN